MSSEGWRKCVVRVMAPAMARCVSFCGGAGIRGWERCGGEEVGRRRRRSVSCLVTAPRHLVQQESEEVRKAGCDGVSTSYGTRSNSIERDAVAWALRAYLCKHKDVAPADADYAIKEAPWFSRKMVAAVKADLPCGRLGYVSHLDEERCRNYAEKFFVKEGVNLLEPFLESLGVDPCNFSQLIPLVKLDWAELVASVKVLEDVGIQRKQMWKVLERDKQLFSCSAAQLHAEIQSLAGLGFSQACVSEIAYRCPALLRLGLENVVSKAELAGRQAEEEEEEGEGKGLADDEEQQDGLKLLRRNVRYLKRELGFSNKQIIKLAHSTSRVLFSDMATVTQPNIDILRKLGLSNTDIRRVLGYSPAVTNLSQGTISSKVDYLRSLGVQDVGKVVTRFPAILQYNVDSNVEPKISYLKSLGVDSSGLGKVLTQCPSVLGYSLDKKLKPTIAFLESLGLKGEKLAKLIVTKPPVLAYSLEGSYADTREFLMKLGLVPGTKAMARAFAASFSSSVLSMQARFDFFLAKGFPRESVRDMLRTQPSLLCLSDQNLLSKLTFYSHLINLFEMPPTRVAVYLSFGLESRVKPRLRVMSWLKDRGLLPKDYSVQRILDFSESQFATKFVVPFPAAERVFHDNKLAVVPQVEDDIDEAAAHLT